MENYLFQCYNMKIEEGDKLKNNLIGEMFGDF